MNKINLFAISILTAISATAEKIEPYSGSRIFWDLSSKKTVFQSGIYSRIIELQDGRLLAVAEGGGINISLSDNGGKSWSSANRIINNPDKVNYAVPDLLQLKDGTIIIGYNPRPNKPYSSDRKFGIRALRSTDGGKTWSEPIFVFDADYTGENGCWEPCFLELPSGELQCYFADESPYTSSNEQQISMCRSFDKGLTWSKPVKVCFRAGSRDGMPVPVLLDNKEIAVIIEDNGWPGRDGKFTATTVRCPLSDNWGNGFVDANSYNRNIIFATTPKVGVVSAAPYLRVLPNGETIASFQGNDKRLPSTENYYDMFVVVGDKEAKNFKAQSAPFARAAAEHSLWNSLSVLSDGSVLAISSYGKADGGGTSVEMIKGYPMNTIKAAYSDKIVIDGNTTGEAWTAKYASQLYMGTAIKNRTMVDFAYDNDNLYVTARVTDSNIVADGSDNDGVRFFFDVDDVCGTSVEKGMYRILLDTNGKLQFDAGENGAWKTINETSSIKYVANVKSSYYQIEAAIPWKMLGQQSAPVGKRMAAAVEIIDKENYTRNIEAIPDVDNDKSSTWMEFRLQGGNGGVTDTPSSIDKTTTVVTDSSAINIRSSKEIEHASLYSFDGRKIFGTDGKGTELSIPKPYGNSGGVLKIRFINGREESHKILF